MLSFQTAEVTAVSPLRSMLQTVLSMGLPMITSLVMAQQPLPSQTSSPATADCISEMAGQGNKMQFFICLNAKREACQDQLLMIQAECGSDSPKYKGAFSRYLELRAASNVFLDVVISELRFKNPVSPEQAKTLVDAVNLKFREFETYNQRTSCEGETNKVLPSFIPAIGSWLVDKARDLMGGWFAGERGERKEKADQLTQQRWKSPNEFGAAFPTLPKPDAGRQP